MSKICAKCKRRLEERGFSLNPTKKDGLNEICRKCHSEYRREYYLKNKDREKLLVSRYKEKQRRDTCVEVPCSVCGKMIWRRKRDVERCCESFCSNSCRASFGDKGVINYYLKEAHKRADIKGLNFDIDYEYLHHLFYIIQGGKCAITGVEIKLYKRPKAEGIHVGASLDRIDCSVGYVRGNVRFVALGINYMKNDAPDWQVYELIKRIRASSSVIECDSSKVEVVSLSLT